MAADRLAVEPITGALDADVALPGSKSVTNRALVCAALAAGTSTLRRFLVADDTEAMVAALSGLGVGVGLGVDDVGDVATVDGRGGRFAGGDLHLDARMSGTTARFLLPLLPLATGAVTLDGHPQLRRRPMAAGIDALRQLGTGVDELGTPGHLPVAVTALGSLEGGTVRLAGDVSSQFLSGLLLAAPAMRTGVTVELTGTLVSRPYVDLTASVMATFGAAVETSPAADRYRVDPGGYRATEVRIEPDASAASYFFAAAAVCGGRVRVADLGRSTVQGDLRFVEVLAAMGCQVEVGDGFTEVRGTGILDGVDVDLAAFSDTAPTLAVVAAFAASPTRVRGIGFIRRKESDRIAAVVTELRRCGVGAEETDDGFVVQPVAGGPQAATIETYDDHRLAMSFAVLGLRVPGTVILDPACVAKTFPGYFEALDGLRVGSAPR